MSRDPIVDEVRRIREAYAKRFNYDLSAIAEDLKRRQRERGRKTVKFAPKMVSELPRAVSTKE